MRTIVRCLVFCLMVVGLMSSGASAAPRWDNPQPQGNIIADLASNGSIYVAVGNAGTILTSTDGALWQRATSGTTAWLEAVRWNDTQRQFVVTGNGGTLLTSPDGVQWTRRASGVEGYLYGIANNGGLNVAVGSSGAVTTSSDGAQWSAGSTGILDWLNDVAWNGHEFVAVGGNGTIVASADGVHWVRRNSAVRSSAGTGPSLESIAWSPDLGRWVAVSEIGPGPQGNTAYAIWSNDGLTWNPVAAGGQPLRGIVWSTAQMRFVGVGGSGRVMVSGDGINWGPPNDTGYGESLESIITTPAGFLAAGQHGLMLTAADPTGNWSRQGSGPLASLSAVAFDGTGYVGVGNGEILHRGSLGTAGLDVITQVQGGALPFLRGIAFGGGQYVAVGDGGLILRSTDGVSWSVDATTGINLTGAVRAGDGSWYVAGAQGAILRNVGQGWVQVRSGSEKLNGIAADSTGLVAAGSSGSGGVVVTSGDGVHWSTTGVSVALKGVASGNGRRVAAGNGGAVAVSTGGGWSVGNAGTSSDLQGVTWDGRRFIAVGRDGATFASGDGAIWSLQTVTGNDLFGVAAAAGAFLVAGEGGSLVYTACPCATNDQAVTLQNQPVTIPVLANDSGDNLVLRGVDTHSAQGGSVVANPDGTVTYTPRSGFTGSDSFSYTLGTSMDPAATDTANVMVLVNGRSSSGSGSSGGGGGGGADALWLPLLWLMSRRRSRAAHAP